MKPYILGFLCSCFVVSQAIYLLLGGGGPTSLAVTGPTFVWVFIAPLVIMYSPLDDYSLRWSVLTCSVAGLCFVALVGGAMVLGQTRLGLTTDELLFPIGLIVAALLAVPVAVGLTTILAQIGRTLTAWV